MCLQQEEKLLTFWLFDVLGWLSQSALHPNAEVIELSDEIY